MNPTAIDASPEILSEEPFKIPTMDYCEQNEHLPTGYETFFSGEAGSSVSFDFDGTLSRPDVQQYAAELIRRGLNVWVVTARFDENHQYRYQNNPANTDLWAVTDALKILPQQVRFQNMRPKAEYLEGTRIIWHLDDDPVELSQMQKSTCCSVVGISVLSGGWQQKCERALSTLTPVEEQTAPPRGG